MKERAISPRPGLFLASILVLVLCWGCGPSEKTPGGSAKDLGDEPAQAVPGDESDPDEEEPSTNGSADRVWDPALGTAAVKGVAKFSGEPPARQPVDMSKDASCHEQHAEPALDESLIVGADGGLANVFVWVAWGLEGWEFPVPKEPASLGQQGCRFVPHVLGVRSGQPVRIRNSDTVLHNLHSFSRRNVDFNFGQAAGKENVKVFGMPEVMLKVKCDVHAWMSAYVGVVEHPYFAVTGADGVFELEKLPPGKYTVKAWHERLGIRSLTVTVGAKEHQTIGFTYHIKPED